MSNEVFNHEWTEENGDLVSMRMWQVPVSPSCPEGRSYSFVCIRNGKRLLGYDNENHGTGVSNHHKHIRNRISPYAFIDEWTLYEDFANDLDKIRRGVIQ